MASHGEDRRSGAEDVFHCLECGATLSADATRCPSCGNERLILPERWTPPDETRSGPVGRATRLGEEARVLVGLSLALFCALALLGAARIRTEARLNTETTADVEVVATAVEETQTESGIEGADASAPVPLEESISTLRESAREAEDVGAWFEAASLWSEVTKRPQARLNDFLSLARAWENAGDSTAASAALGRACATFPDSAEAYAAIGALNERLGNMSAARLQYQVGLSYCPGDRTLREGLERCEKELRAAAVAESFAPPPEIAETEPPEEEPGPTEEPEEAPASEVESSVSEPTYTHEEPAPSDENGRVTLIGLGPEAVEDQQAGEAESGAGRLVEVLDLDVDASDERVVIRLGVNGAAELSSRFASDPPRLVVRLPHARVAQGADAPNGVALGVELVEQVRLVEGADDNTVILIVYLGEEARYSVTAEAGAVTVEVVPAQWSEAR